MNDPQNLLSTLRDEGVQLWVHEGQLRYRCRSGLLDPVKLAELKRQKEDIIALLLKPSVAHTTPLAGRPRPPVLPLSFAQEGLWFLHQWGMQGAAYNFPTAISLRGELDLRALERAVREVVRRHEILRTRYRMVDGVGAQVIGPSGELFFELMDLSALPALEKSERARQLMLIYAEHAFDLELQYPIRFHLLRIDELEHILVIIMHHIVIDSWSLGLLFRELSVLYEAFRQGQDSPLPELPAQYADYALWQRQRLQGDVLSKQLSYWKSRLAGAPESLDLPVDNVRPPVQSFRGGFVEFKLSSTLSATLSALTRQHEMTPFMVLLAAYQALLSRLSGQRDVVVGTPIDGRSHPQAESLIGYFLNTLVLRADLSGDLSFSDLLKQVKTSVIDAYEHRDLPFDQLVAALRPDRDQSRQPIFQALFTYQGQAQDDLKLHGLKISPLQIEHRTAKFDLALLLWETDEQLEGGFEYATDLFERATIERFVTYFQTLLTAVVTHPQTPLSKLPLLSEAERRQLLVQWNDTQAIYPSQRCPHELFEQQVTRNPESLAVVFEGQRLSYGELNARANQLAHHLRGLGVGPDTLVGLCMERSIEMLVGLLGILKAGGAYVPLDPEYPQERLAFMIEDAGLYALLTQRQLVANLPEQAAPVICLDDDRPEISRQSDQNPSVTALPHNLAYVLYTSGSTGRPKGVAMWQQTISNLICWQLQNSTLPPGARTLQYTSLNFDVSSQEIFSTWCAGGTLVLVTKELRRDPEALLRYLDEQRIERLFLPFVALHQLTEVAEELQYVPKRLREVITAGEQLQITPTVVGFFQKLGDCVLYNHYGPTESHVITSYTLTGTPANWPKLPPIGRPNANVHIYILDEELEPVPIGVPGELYIGGDTLARGYLHRAGLTAERFIPNPFGPAGSRLYRTGDRASYRPDGQIEFLGRLDHQIKLRGFRIELGEIESTLRRCQGVAEAVVLACQERPTEEKRLVAYLVASGGQQPSASELRRQLQKRLPEYMVPAAYEFLEALPVNPNGKVDRERLPKPEAIAVDAGVEYVEPRTATEELLAGIWAEVLKVERVGVHDNFFALGGHSLTAMQLVARIRQTIQATISLRDLFSAPTVAELAHHLGSAQALPRQQITRSVRSAPTLTSYAQQRLWFLDQFQPGTALYNIPLAWRLHGPLNIQALSRSLQQLIERHESLRTTFAAPDGLPLQVIAEQLLLPLPLTDLSLHDGETEAHRLQQEEAERPFDLGRGPLVRASLIKLSAEEHLLLLTLHHIICDGWSLGLLQSELSRLYNGYCTGEDVHLPELPIQYADYSEWQREELQGEAMSEHLAYWKGYLKDAPRALELPTDKPRPPSLSHAGAVVEFSLSAELSRGVRELSQHLRATPFMVLAAVFEIMLHRYSGQREVCVGYPVANRHRVEVEAVVGFFVNMLVLRADVRSEASFEELVGEVREAVLDGERHEEMPFEKLVEELRPERDLSRQPLFQAMILLNNTDASQLELHGLTVQTAEGESNFSKYELSLGLNECNGQYQGSFEYSTELFERETIERMVGHFKTLLEAVIAQPEARVRDLPLLTVDERRQLLVEWNQTQSPQLPEQSLQEMFEAQVVQNPEAVALVSAGGAISYRELNGRANQVAHALRQMGIGPEKAVGVCLERGTDLVVGMLGVLKAGGAYVPLDAEYPPDRIAFMLRDASAEVLLTQQGHEPHRCADDAKVLLLDADWTKIAQQSKENPESRAAGGNLAYIIYTSGSTGQPKGVAIEHHSAVALINWSREHFKEEQLAGVLASTSICFDLSVFELFMTLCRGGKVILAENALQLPALAAREEVRLINTVPSAIAELLRNGDIPSSITTVCLAGEALPDALAQQLYQLEHISQVYNLYGPTEDTTYSTCALIEKDASATVTIGKPIANTQAYILDEELEPVPIGVPGELYLGGAGLARGYLHRAGLTAERFIPNPFGPAGSRLYRTGDRAKYRPDGQIEFLGRLDHQIKLRGFRIELGEIESTLRCCRGVAEAVVVLREEEARDKRLVAYVVGGGAEPAAAASELRRQLQKRLPEYMVPAAYEFLEALPVNPNGKVDRERLPKPEAIAVDAGVEYVEPRTATEELLAGIWAEVLKVERVGVHDNFFALGGHSLSAMQLVARIARFKSYSLPLRDIFLHPTIAELAIHLENNGERATVLERQSDTIKRLPRVKSHKYQ